MVQNIFFKFDTKHAETLGNPYKNKQNENYHM